MARSERIAIVLAALVAGSIGGLLGSFARERSTMSSSKVIETTRLVVRDPSTDAFAVLEVQDGQPMLRFIEKTGTERIFIGLKSGEPSVDLSRSDGSSIALSPIDGGPGFQLFNLESHGQGRGVFMSTLTANELTILQSGLGGVVVGRVGPAAVGVEVRDGADRLVGKIPR